MTGQDSGETGSGHHRAQEKGPTGERPAVLAVDRALLIALEEVEEAADAHLRLRSEGTRRDLTAALARLDSQGGDADAFTVRPRGGRLGTVPLPGVIGATGYSPVTAEVGSDEFRAQVELVHAVRDEVRSPSAGTFGALERADADLDTAREPADA